MTQQDEGPDRKADIQRQFAALQAEMQRVMAEPAATSPTPAQDAGEAIDFERIERSLEDLRRDADRLHTSMAEAADGPALGDSIAALRARIEEIGRQADEGMARLNRSLQGNREAVAAVSLRLDALAHRLPSRWLTPLAILLGAVVIAGAVLASAPGSLDALIDRAGPLIEQPKHQSEAAEPPAPPSPAAAPAPSLAALAPPPPTVIEPAPASPAPAPAPAPAPPAVAAAEPTPLPAVAGAPPPTAEPAPPPPPPVAVAAPTPPSVAAVQPPATTPTAPPGQIVLRAKADAWVEVKNRQGADLLARLLHAGETWTVPPQPSLVLTTGNAGGLELLVDGTPAPALGTAGAIRRDVPLDPALVRAGRYTAETSAPPKASTASR